MGPFHVAIVGIICGSILAYLNLKNRKTKESDELERQLEEQQQQLEVLTQRVQALEKIVTSNEYNLKEQIDRL